MRIDDDDSTSAEGPLKPITYNYSAYVTWQLPTTPGDYEIFVAVGTHQQRLTGKDRLTVLSAE
ncbi:MAG: hypothetical protein A2289_15465 [Deltaproteobacteria bacterium RIFOXYA12_FULL_58_15]|nr:MAG: hypothetical protein A2289_15465 [Deltaproteobacteria bacterium RIFOXYA12_FULL_58_15]